MTVDHLKVLQASGGKVPAHRTPRWPHQPPLALTGSDLGWSFRMFPLCTQVSWMSKLWRWTSCLWDSGSVWRRCHVTWVRWKAWMRVIPFRPASSHTSPLPPSPSRPIGFPPSLPPSTHITGLLLSFALCMDQMCPLQLLMQVAPPIGWLSCASPAPLCPPPLLLFHPPPSSLPRRSLSVDYPSSLPPPTVDLTDPWEQRSERSDWSKWCQKWRREAELSQCLMAPSVRFCMNQLKSDYSANIVHRLLKLQLTWYWNTFRVHQFAIVEIRRHFHACCQTTEQQRVYDFDWSLTFSSVFVFLCFLIINQQIWMKLLFNRTWFLLWNDLNLKQLSWQEEEMAVPVFQRFSNVFAF